MASGESSGSENENVFDVSVNFSDNEQSESDFSGFNESDIEHALQNAAILREIPMEQSEKDRIYENDWNREDSPPLVAPFTGQSGINIDFQDDISPIMIYKSFFPDEFVNLLVEQTNLYAERNIQKRTPLPPSSRFRQWTPVTLGEMKRFLALIISMGLCRKAHLEDYWSTNECHNVPFFSKYMAKNRFMLILTHLHLVDNQLAVPRGQPNHDALFKVRPLLTLLNNKFSEVYSPNQDLSLDEATCPFKGRVRFRVYNPCKPQKFGIKLFQVCEADSGYCIAFNVYSGQGDDELEHYAVLVGCNDCTKTTQTVVGLLAKAGLLNKGHHIYLDNYYNSPELATELGVNDTYMCGTLRTNRKEVPKVFSQVKKLPQGDTIFRRNDNTLVVKFHDKRDISLISTFHEATMAFTDKFDNHGNPIMKPTIIVDYVKKMGGVDLSDQIIQYYSALRKTVKWSLKLFLHLFNLMLVNAFIVSKKAGVVFQNKRRGHIAFREAVVEALLEESSTVPLPGRKGRRVNPIGRLTERHFPEYIPAKAGAKRKRPLRDCKACNKSIKDRVGFKRKQTSFMCAKCNVSLCVPDCFTVWHSRQNFRTTLPAVHDSDASDSD